jgi:hypothetical protein
MGGNGGFIIENNGYIIPISMENIGVETKQQNYYESTNKRNQNFFRVGTRDVVGNLVNTERGGG